jgi:hypothetical protein
VDKVQWKKALLSGPSGQGNPGMGSPRDRGVCLWIYHGILTLMGGEDSLNTLRSQKSSALPYYAGLSFPWSKNGTKTMVIILDLKV